MKHTLLFLLLLPFNLHAQSVNLTNDLQRNDGVKLDGDWKYKVGDNSGWSKPNIDDSDWQHYESLNILRDSLLKTSRKNTIFWLRRNLFINKTLTEELVTQISQIGESEIYLDGNLILSSGSSSDDKEKTYYPFPLKPGKDQILAIRFITSFEQLLQAINANNSLLSILISKRSYTNKIEKNTSEANRNQYATYTELNKLTFEKYTASTELPEISVQDIIQDDMGFIWLTTQNGLLKFDGYDFQFFHEKALYDESVDFHNMNNLVKGKEGKIWIGNLYKNGIVTCFDPKYEKFKNYGMEKDSGAVQKYFSGAVLLEDENNNIWLTKRSYNGDYHLFRNDLQTDFVTKYEGNFNFSVESQFKGIEALDGTVWLLDKKSNLLMFNEKLDKFEKILTNEAVQLPSGISDTLIFLHKSNEKQLLLTGKHSIHLFDTESKTIKKSYYKDLNGSLLDHDIRFSVIDQIQHILIGYEGGNITIINPRIDSIRHYKFGEKTLKFTYGPKRIMGYQHSCFDDEGVWIKAIGYNYKTAFYLHYSFANQSFDFFDLNFNIKDNPFPSYYNSRKMIQDKTGLIWMGDHSGLYKQSPKSKHIELFQHNEKIPTSLPSNHINYLFEDSRHRIWVGTKNGIAIFKRNLSEFEIHKFDSKNNTTLSNNNISWITEDNNGKIWVATYNGINRWNDSRKYFDRFFYDPKDGRICSFIEPDNKGSLWLSIFNEGLYEIDAIGNILKRPSDFGKNDNIHSSKWLGSVFQDSKGIMWFGDSFNSENGLFRLNHNQDSLIHYSNAKNNNFSISDNGISFITEDIHGKLWIATNRGVNRFDYENECFTRFNIGSVTSYINHKNGDTWFGTYSSNGLASVNKENDSITFYDHKKGLLDNDLPAWGTHQFCIDEAGRFWLPTKKGLSVFDPDRETFKNYFEKDGFQKYSRGYVSIRSSNGDIWIGGENGLNHIVPKQLINNDSTLASIIITGMKIMGKNYKQPDGKIFKTSVAYSNEISLKHFFKDITLEFVALHYLDSENNQYSWKLEGYDKDWSIPSFERSAKYFNLSSGQYLFKVKGSNANGVWNSDIAYIAITILPPWWRSTIAYILYGLLFIITIYIYERYRKKRIIANERAVQKEKELAHAREIEKAYNKLELAHQNLKVTQSQLIQSEKMASLGELTAGIAHEIQNPLNFVNNFSEISWELIEEMKEEIKNGDYDESNAIADDIKQNLEKINHHGKRAADIVKGMLQHSRNHSGQKELTDINALADEYLRLAYHGLRAKDKYFNADFKLETDKKLHKIDVFPQDIGRVFLNLMNNAFYAVSEKAKQIGKDYKPLVTISVKLLDNKVEIRVSDNGNGIPKNIKEKIFQPFFTTKPTGQGTGLGLSMSYDIVKAHSGELKVETLSGTCFILTLPI